MILVKIHTSSSSMIVCLCDSELIGKKLQDKNHQLEITERFYKGISMPEEKMLSLLKIASSINIIGRESISFAIKSGIISKESVTKIKNIPHAQVFRLG